MAEDCTVPTKLVYLHFSLIDDVKIIALIALLDDYLSAMAAGREHGIENVRPLILVQMRKEHVLGNGFSKGFHSLVVFGHHFLDIVGCLLLRHRFAGNASAAGT